MNKTKWFFSVCTVVLLTGVGTASAQTTFAIGPRIGYDFGTFEELSIGTDVRIGIATLPILIAPALDYYFVDEGSLLQIDINALFPFGIDNQMFTPYFGAGVGISRSSIEDFDATDTGLNILGGAVFGFGNIRPYAQLKAKVTGDWEVLAIQGGLIFQLGQ
jgi:hypothetical protein